MSQHIFQKVNKKRVLFWAFFWLTAIVTATEGLTVKGVPFNYRVLEPFILRGYWDDWVHNAFLMNQMKHTHKEVNPSQDQFSDFIFIGGSAALEAITSDVEMEGQLRELTGKSIRFNSLCSSYRTFSDDSKVVDNLGNYNGALLISMELFRLNVSIDKQLEYTEPNGNILLKYFYLTTNKEINRVLSENGKTLDFSDQVTFFRTMKTYGKMTKKVLARFYKHKGFIRTEYSRHIGEKPPVSKAFYEKIKKGLIENTAARYEKNSGFNLALLRIIINRARQNGLVVFLVEQPYNPLFTSVMEQHYPLYNKNIRELMDQTGAGYINMKDGIDWKPEDFRDSHHLRKPGQIKFTNALAPKLAEMITAKAG